MSFEEDYANPNLTLKELAIKYNTTEGKIRYRATKSNLPLCGRIKNSREASKKALTKITISEYENIKKMYIENKFTTKEIGEYYNISPGQIARILKKINVIARVGEERDKYEIHHSYFKKLTPLKCRILGLLASDGDINITPTGRTRIRFSSKDIELINLINDEIGGAIYTEIGCKRNYILSNEIGEDLQSFGICPNKSLTLQINWDKIGVMKNYFLLGLIEGDGCIVFNEKKDYGYVPRIDITSGSNDFCKQIQNLYPQFNGKQCKITESKDQTKDIFTFHILTTNRKDCLELSYILKNAAIECGMLKRKYDKICRMIEFLEKKRLQEIT